MRDPDAGLFRMLARAIMLRCPRCGAGSIFRSYGELEPNCPGCGLRFERESGYWVGSMIINMAATIVVLLGVLLVGLLATWPEPPWTPLTVGVVAAAGATPILFHRWSRTLWLAVEMSYHALEDDEVIAAREAMGG